MFFPWNSKQEFCVFHELQEQQQMNVTRGAFAIFFLRNFVFFIRNFCFFHEQQKQQVEPMRGAFMPIGLGDPGPCV
jgi:hypothetical protein